MIDGGRENINETQHYLLADYSWSEKDLCKTLVNLCKTLVKYSSAKPKHGSQTILTFVLRNRDI